MSEKDKSGGIASFGVGFGPGGSKNTPPQVAERPPFRIVVVGEFTPRPDHQAGSAPPREPTPIDKQSFDEVMGRLAPTTRILVHDPFAPDAQPLEITLKWAEMKALRPDAMVDQIPVLRALVDAHKVVQAVTQRQVKPADARQQLAKLLPRPQWADALTSEVVDNEPVAAPAPAAAAPAPAATPAAASGGGLLDSLLDKVEIPSTAADEPGFGTPSPSTGDSYADILGSVVRGMRPVATPAPVVGKAPERVAQAFHRIVGEVLRHPQVRRLERSWRGLRLLVERADFRRGVEVDVISASPSEVEPALLSLVQRSGPEAERAAVDLVVVDHDLKPTAADLEKLEKWGALGEALRAPIVVNGDASMLGFDDLDGLVRAKKRLTQIDDPRAVALRSVASRDPARWICVALNGVLVRAPYTGTTSRLRELPYVEEESDSTARVFAGPGFVVAALAAGSYARVGWPCALTGPRNGLLENLPIWNSKDGSGQPFALPLEVLANTEAQSEAARAGLTLLSCAPNHDAAILSRAPVIYRGPSQPAGDSPAETQLADQLFVGRVANAIEQIGAAIPADSDPKAASEVARLALAELFEGAAPPRAPETMVRVTPEKALEVTIRPHQYVGVGIEEFTLAAPLAKA